MRKVVHLAPGECIILSCLSDERTYKEIALDLGVSINSVETWIKRAYRKLAVNDRHSAVQVHRRLIRSQHRCNHLRVRDALITDWELRGAVT